VKTAIGPISSAEPLVRCLLADLEHLGDLVPRCAAVAGVRDELTLERTEAAVNLIASPQSVQIRIRGVAQHLVELNHVLGRE
jgi:hypothetical protein